MCTLNFDANTVSANDFFNAKAQGATRRHLRSVASITLQESDAIREIREARELREKRTNKRKGKTLPRRIVLDRIHARESLMEFGMNDTRMNDNDPDIDLLMDMQFGSASSHHLDDGYDDTCMDCGWNRCQCGIDDDLDRDHDRHAHADDLDMDGDRYDPFDDYYPYYDSLDSFPSRSSFLDVHGTFRLDRHNIEPVLTAEEAHKLSDELWDAHEFFFGRNNLATMSKQPIDYHCYDSFADDWACRQYYDDEAVNEFGGLPNHFTVDRTFTNINSENGYMNAFGNTFGNAFGNGFDFAAYDLATSMSMSDLAEFYFGSDDMDFAYRPDANTARRQSRFFETTGGKFKRPDRFGCTSSRRWMNLTGEDKDIQRTKDKTAAKRELKRVFSDSLGELLVEKSTGGRKMAVIDGVAMEKFIKATSKRSAPRRHMITRMVQVTRVGIIDGRRKIISDRLEAMECRR